MTSDRCPGCGARFGQYHGPTHRYIGAHPACWALFSALVAGQAPDPSIIATSAVPDIPRALSADEEPPTQALLVDAYAAQHPGKPSPQAIQSVAVHLLTLHGVFEGGVAATEALWIRRRALRRRGAFHWLPPPPHGGALTLRHLFSGGGVSVPVTVGSYARSVFRVWAASHGAQIRAWYAREVLGD